MYYIMDEEGFRSGGGLFSNIFRSRGERMGAGANIGVNKVCFGCRERNRPAFSWSMCGRKQSSTASLVWPRCILGHRQRQDSEWW
jgi:hypothetical protein